MGNEASYWQLAIPYLAGEKRGREQVVSMKTFLTLQFGLLLVTKTIEETLTTTTRELQPTLNSVSDQV